MSTMTDRARKELELQGLFSKEGDFYGGMTGKSVMELYEVFSKQGHSGMSAGVVTELFYRLARGEALSPLTNSPDEWREVHIGTNGKPVYQNLRNSACFSYDGRKTYYCLDEKRKWLRKMLPFSIYRRLPQSWKYPFHTTKKVDK